MRERRNLILISLLFAVIVWAFIVWLVLPASGTVWVHRWTTAVAILILAGLTYYVLNIEDKLPDHLGQAVGPVYFDVEGLSFMPTIRMREDGQAELSVYYQNRYENYCNAIIHLRPPVDSFSIGAAARDVHFSFKADGGDFGVVHQPIAVPRHLRGEVIQCLLAAAVRFPRSHGGRLLARDGMSCGTFAVDWAQAFKVGVHEVSGEIELKNPCQVRLTMPPEAREDITGSPAWRQETIHAGPSETAVLT